jgi:hypothetical protein
VIAAGYRKAGIRNCNRSQLPVVLAAKIEYGQHTRNDALGGGSTCERGLSGAGRRGGGAERCHSRLGGGFPSLGRSPRTEAFVARARKRHSIRFAAGARALIEPGHESGIPPTSPTSHVQFERPRLVRRPGNHRSPASGTRRTRGWTPPDDEGQLRRWAANFCRRWQFWAPAMVETFKAELRRVLAYLCWPARWRHRLRATNLSVG